MTASCRVVTQCSLHWNYEFFVFHGLTENVIYTRVSTSLITS